MLPFAAVHCGEFPPVVRGDAPITQVVIALWMTGSFFQNVIEKAADKATGIAVVETLQMAGGGASRADVLELCAAVLHVKSGCAAQLADHKPSF